MRFTATDNLDASVALNLRPLLAQFEREYVNNRGAKEVAEALGEDPLPFLRNMAAIQKQHDELMARIERLEASGNVEVDQRTAVLFEEPQSDIDARDAAIAAADEADAAAKAAADAAAAEAAAEAAKEEEARQAAAEEARLAAEEARLGAARAAAEAAQAQADAARAAAEEAVRALREAQAAIAETEAVIAPEVVEP